MKEAFLIVHIEPPGGKFEILAFVEKPLTPIELVERVLISRPDIYQGGEVAVVELHVTSDRKRCLAEWREVFAAAGVSEPQRVVEAVAQDFGRLLLELDDGPTH